jgi:hypothetical protein
MTKAAAFQPASFTNAFARTADKKVRTHTVFFLRAGIIQRAFDLESAVATHLTVSGLAAQSVSILSQVCRPPLGLHTSALLAVSAILSQTLVSNAGLFVDFKITLPIQSRTFSLISQWIHRRAALHEKQKCWDSDKAALSRN